MSKKKIYHKNPEVCTGCMVCELVCSLRFEKNGVNPKRSNIKILTNPEKGIFTPNVCQQCEDNPCITACPSNALYRNSNTGAIAVKEDDCSGCGLCMDECVYNAIHIHPELKVARICDLCDGEPLCVKYCMQEALLFVTPVEYENYKNKTADM